MKALTLSSRSRTVVIVAALGAAYYVAGKLGLCLAIPPGYATAVFPSAGIALAGLLLGGYRLWPGVFLGSFLVNLGVTLHTAGPGTFAPAAGLSACLAAGASLQALAGTFLVRRFAVLPLALVAEADVLRLLVLGGPLSCLVSASVGVSALFLAGAIQPADYAFSWFTWWVGDTIGVLIFCPSILLWDSRPARGWPRRLVLVSGPLAVACALVVALFLFTSKWEQGRLKLGFDQQADRLASRVANTFDNYLEVLHSIEGLYRSSAEVTWPDFTSFVGRALQRHPGIQALAWNPLVPAEARAGFEANARTNGPPDFQISELDERGRPVPAGVRAEYAPVAYIEPRAGNRRALGFDALSEPGRREALVKARATGKPTGTKRVALIQDTNHESGFLVYLPVFGKDRPEGTGEGQRGPLRGYIVGVFRIGDILRSTLGAQALDALELRIEDQGAPEPDRLLYAVTRTEASPGFSRAQFHRTVSFDIASRHWLFQFSSASNYLTVHRTWHAWTVLASGLLFAALLGALLLVVTGQTAQIETVVGRRTAQLEAANRELEAFAYSVSHDLRAPLRHVTSFVDLLREETRSLLPRSAQHHLNSIAAASARMGTLIEDLLAFSRLGRAELRHKPVDLNGLVREVIQELTPEARGRVIVWKEGPLPPVNADRALLRQALANLLGNAIKYTRPRTPAEIEIGCAADSTEESVLYVRDNGVGFDAAHVDKLFGVFQRLHPPAEFEGTGIGLAIVRRIIARHGGRTWAEGKVDGGATFYFSLPK